MPAVTASPSSLGGVVTSGGRADSGVNAEEFEGVGGGLGVVETEGPRVDLSGAGLRSTLDLRGVGVGSGGIELDRAELVVLGLVESSLLWR